MRVLEDTAVSLPTKRAAIRPRGRALLFSSFLTLGSIFGDLGTSCIYTLSSIFDASDGPPIEEDVIGAVSAIIWVFTLIALVKYTLIATAFASEEGEGGCFSLFTSIYRIVEPDDVDEIAAVPGLAIFRQERHPHKRLLRRPIIKWSCLILALFGTALTLADGTLTPPISVTSAIEGLALEAPSLVGKTYGIAIAILVLLFSIQQLGTQQISVVFAPIVLLWLILLCGTGIANSVAHPAIFRAFDVSRAVAWFKRTGDFWSLGSVALSITGAEALFAGLGHFSPAAIRLAFLGVVYPSLILQYMGQGARLITDGEFVVQAPFYNSLRLLSMPLYWIGFVLAVLATIIASQALITASFSLYQQLESFNCAPSIRLTHTSTECEGQVYAGKLNWVLMIACIALTAGFKTSDRLAHAYALATIGVMLLSTLLISISVVAVKGWHWSIAIGYLLIFGFVEGCLFGATTQNIVEGAWYSVGMACIVGLFLVLWFWMANLELSYDTNHRVALRRLVSPYATAQEEIEAKTASDNAAEVVRNLTLSRFNSLDSQSHHSMEEKQGFGVSSTIQTNTLCSPTRVNTASDLNALATKHTDTPLHQLYLVPHPLRILLTRPPVFALFHTTSSLSRGAPPSLSGFLQRYPALPRVTCMTMIRIMAVPHVEQGDRVLLARYPEVEGVYEVLLRWGFRDEVNLCDVHKLIGRKLLALEERLATGDLAECRRRREAIIEAAASASIHVFTHYHLEGKPILQHVPILGQVLTVLRARTLRFFNKMASLTPVSDGYVLDEETILRVGLYAVV